MIIKSEISEYDKNVTVYSFESRGTDYTIFQKPNEFEVWSQRKSLSFNPKIRFFDNLSDLSKVSKVFKELAVLIAA